MFDPAGLAAVLLAPKSIGYWLLTLAAGVIAAVVFLVNVQHRDTLGHTIKAPERRLSYDAAALDKFIADASAIKTRFGDDALAHYLRPTLLWNDVVFAVALGLFAALVALGVAPWLPWQPWAGRLMLFAALMGVLYGITDVLEDLKLSAILDKGVPVAPIDATIASWLTRIKIATNTLSIFGAVAFLLLQAAASLVR